MKTIYAWLTCPLFVMIYIIAAVTLTINFFGYVAGIPGGLFN